MVRCELNIFDSKLFDDVILNALLTVDRADVTYHDMEEIDKMQSIPELERLLPLLKSQNASVYFYTITHIALTHVCVSCFVTVFYAVFFKLTSLSQNERSCWSCMCRLCSTAESSASKRSKLLLSCPSSSPSTRRTLVI